MGLVCALMKHPVGDLLCPHRSAWSRRLSPSSDTAAEPLALSHLEQVHSQRMAKVLPVLILPGQQHITPAAGPCGHSETPSPQEPSPWDGFSLRGRAEGTKSQGCPRGDEVGRKTEFKERREKGQEKSQDVSVPSSWLWAQNSGHRSPNLQVPACPEQDLGLCFQTRDTQEVAKSLQGSCPQHSEGRRGGFRGTEKEREGQTRRSSKLQLQGSTRQRVKQLKCKCKPIGMEGSIPPGERGWHGADALPFAVKRLF